MFPYLTGSHDSRSKPLWMDCAIEDSIKSTYLTTSGANRSCRCLWNFPLHKLSRTDKQKLGKNPHLLYEHAIYTHRGLFSAVNTLLPREPPPKKRTRREGKKYRPSCLNLCGKKKEFHNILPIRATFLKRKNSPSKTTKQQLTLV